MMKVFNMKITIDGLPESFREKEFSISLKDANFLKKGNKLINFCRFIEYISKATEEIRKLDELSSLRDEISNKLFRVSEDHSTIQKKLEAYKIVASENNNQFSDKILLLRKQKELIENQKSSLSDSLKDINRRMEEIKSKL